MGHDPMRDTSTHDERYKGIEPAVVASTVRISTARTTRNDLTVCRGAVQFLFVSGAPKHCGTWIRVLLLLHVLFVVIIGRLSLHFLLCWTQFLEGRVKAQKNRIMAGTNIIMEDFRGRK